MHASAETTVGRAAEPLTREERVAFTRDGFLLKRRFVPPETMRKILAETDSLHERMAQGTPKGVGVAWDKVAEGRPKRIRQLMHSELVCDGLQRVLRSAEMLDVVEALIGPNISLFHSKLLMKSAQDGSVTPWHQDYAYWKKGTNRPLHLNAMLAIDPATRENGCIQFVPGTHARGLVAHENGDTGGTGFSTYLPGYFYPRPDAVAMEMEPGDCVFFNGLVIHGSDGNRSPQHRRANTVAYTVTGDDPSQCREVLRGKGRG